MGKNKIRLTESQLHSVIKESVKKVLNEGIKPYEHFMSKTSIGGTEGRNQEILCKFYDLYSILSSIGFGGTGLDRLKPKVREEILNAITTLCKYFYPDKNGGNDIIDAFINGQKRVARPRDFSIPMSKRYAGCGYKFSDDSDYVEHSPDEDWYHDTYDA